MRKSLLIGALLSISFILFSKPSSTKTHLSTVAKGWSSNSVNATVFRKNSVVSFNKYQYVAFYDSLSYVVLAKRKLGTDKWEVKQTPYKGNIKDAHNIISIMVDGDGFLHMAWDHHNNQLRYCKSIYPESLEMGLKENMIDIEIEGKVTYPEFYKFSNGDLLFAYRDGGSGNGNLVLNRYSVKTKEWSRLHSNLIDGEGKRNAYWQMHLDKNDQIHISWVWRETYDVSTNHDMCYAVSKDGGLTWENSKGEPYKLPINAASSEYIYKIPQKSNLINQTSMTVDELGNPYIATYYKRAEDKCTQFFVIYHNSQGWQQSKVTNRTMDFSLSGGGSRSIPISRPQIIITNKGKTSYVNVIYRDEERNNRACMSSAMISDTLNWTIKELTSFSLGRWEPSYDSEILKKKEEIHLFLQEVGQGQAETTVKMPCTNVYILNITKH